VDALLVIPGGATSAHYREIIVAANLERRPSFVHARTRDTLDALASYGASDVRIAQEAARLVGRILKGDKAGDLPVERPTKFEFVINLRTTKALALEIPPTSLALADEVIE
jgi:putative tryptophan/tyrosine transport system substrate-binding protein